MIIQIVNIVGGFLLATPLLKKLAGVHERHINALHAKVSPFQEMIGSGLNILGWVALIERLGVLSFGDIGSSFPQAAIALLMSYFLAPNFQGSLPFKHILHKSVEQYREWIGVAGLGIGLGSLLFGCVAPACYHLAF